MSPLADLTVKTYREEAGGYWAEVENLPGCFTAADTLEELNANLKEAIASYLGSLEKDLRGFKFHIQKKDVVEYA